MYPVDMLAEAVAQRAVRHIATRDDAWRHATRNDAKKMIFAMDAALGFAVHTVLLRTPPASLLPRLLI